MFNGVTERAVADILEHWRATGVTDVLPKMGVVCLPEGRVRIVTIEAPRESIDRLEQELNDAETDG